MRFLLVLAALLSPNSFLYAQTQVANQSAKYKSELDRNLTLRKVTLLPVTDNIDGIYARPIEERLSALIKNSSRFDFAEANIVGAVKTAPDLEEDPQTVTKVCESLGVDAVFSSRITRGPGGVSMTLDLFLRSDGHLLLQEVAKNSSQTETKELQNQIEALYRKLLDRMPYKGIILSRSGQRVTVNVGTRDGIKKGDRLSAILIFNAKRHPKYGFLVSTEREVLGRIRVEKADDTLSFGTILSELSKDAIQKETKVISDEMVQYSGSGSLSTQKSTSDLVNDPENAPVFGENPREWMPTAPPTFGKAGFKFGFGSYSSSTDLASPQQTSYQAKSSIFPTILVNGELWMTSNWTISALIQQGVITVPNPRTGSTPEKLNIGLSKYAIYVGYSFLLKDTFFGPKIQLFTGYSRYSATTDQGSPIALTSVSYGGMPLGIAGYLPLDPERIWEIGTSLQYYFLTNQQESPATSGATGDATINSFSFFASRKLSEKMRATGSLDFDLYSTKFTGQGSRSDVASTTSQSSTTLMAGIDFLF